MKKTIHLSQRLAVLPIIVATMILPVLAEETTGNKILNSGIVQGLLLFVKDATFVLVFAAPFVGTIVFGICSMRKTIADDHDAPIWKKRMHNALIYSTLTMVSAAIISLVSGYFV